jgi:hypothetical protein
MAYNAYRSYKNPPNPSASFLFLVLGVSVYYLATSFSGRNLTYNLQEPINLFLLSKYTYTN